MRWRFSTFEGLLLLLVVAGAGAVYAWVFYGKGALIGATYALFMCLPIIAFERRIISGACIDGSTPFPRRSFSSRRW